MPPRRAVLQDQTLAYGSDGEFAVVPQGLIPLTLADRVTLDRALPESDRVEFFVARLREGETVYANTRSVTHVVRATPAERCPRCKRRVNALHAEVRCGGDSRASCFAHECGAPIYEWVWENRGQKAYCRWHYDEHVERQRVEEETRQAEEDEERERRRSERRGARVDVPEGLTRAFQSSVQPLPAVLATNTEVEHMPSLLNDERRDPPSSERVLMNVHPDVRQRLRDLLASPEMRGVGYSAFINRACEVAEEQVRARHGEYPMVWTGVTELPTPPRPALLDSPVFSGAVSVPTSRWTEEGIRQVITDRWGPPRPGGMLAAPVRVVVRSSTRAVDVLLPVSARYSDEDWEYIQEITSGELEPFRPRGAVVNFVRGRVEGEV